MSDINPTEDLPVININLTTTSDANAATAPDVITLPASDPEAFVSDAPVLLDDKIKANPDAFNFSDIPLETPNAPQTSTDAGLRTLEAVLGLEMQVAPASPTHPALFFKQVKIKDQRRVMQAIKDMAAAEDDEASLEVLLRLATTLLFQPNPSGEGFLSATQDQIEEAFEAFDLMQLVKSQCGMRGGETGPKA